MINPAVDAPDELDIVLPEVLRRYKAEIGAGLRESLSSDGLPVYQMLQYAMGWSDEQGHPRAATEGKALRPTLCLLACEATGGSVRGALPAAVSVELIHNFSLIHDDIQDRDETRHHRPTLWAAWGDPKALVAGNLLRVIADTALWRLVDEGFAFEKALQAAGLLTEAYLEMIEGQYMDLQYEGRRDIGIGDYLDMVSKKTGALIRCALNLGALLGTGDDRTASAFRRYGSSLGLVFQIRDDVLGIWGDEQATGKPVGADISRKKNTLPAVYAMSQARGGDKQKLLHIYGQATIGDEEVSTVLEIMERTGAKAYAQDLAHEYREVALSALSAVELAPEARADVEEISDFLLTRQH